MSKKSFLVIFPETFNQLDQDIRAEVCAGFLTEHHWPSYKTKSSAYDKI